MHSRTVLCRVVELTFLALACVTFSLPAEPNAPATNSPSVTSKPFGKTPQGELVTAHTVTNKNGVSVSILDYGATIVKILTPDRNGKLDDVVLGFDTLAPYLRPKNHFGGTLGRFGNRIAKGQFSIGKNLYQLPVNDGPNSLHGGIRGFDKRMWKLEPVDSDIPAVRFSRLSPDGEEGYPGNLFVSVTFSLNDSNELRVTYEATTDQVTIVNLTNHSFFNLAGAGTILDHILTVHADSFTPAGPDLIPTGEINKVEGTPFNFLSPTPIGLRLKDIGVKPPGYDVNYVLKKGFFFNWAEAAEVEEPKSGRTLTVSTDQPGLQFYTGNHLDGTLTGVGGNVYRPYTGFCLEPQHFPDSPNHNNFPSAILAPGDTYKSSTVYAFGVK